ncbi:hypothetical protein [Rhizobium ruizarguesonis]|uniref:hypothetical protein n=1 Tax=Rhizobium ruizarguesonis TaxID=2081791 RepID=UPI001FE1D04B|nr:hypothetical protein [Rhizobium ruizarguesonis]
MVDGGSIVLLSHPFVGSVRSLPSSVHARYSISAMSFGFTKIAPLRSTAAAGGDVMRPPSFSRSTQAVAAEAWDQAQGAREVLDRDGQTFTDRFGQPKERPEVGIMQNARIAFARLLRELALDGVDGPDAPRSPRTADYGSRR